jgi:hypothetical protein
MNGQKLYVGTTIIEKNGDGEMWITTLLERKFSSLRVLGEYCLEGNWKSVERDVSMTSFQRWMDSANVVLHPEEALDVCVR